MSDFAPSISTRRKSRLENSGSNSITPLPPEIFPAHLRCAKHRLRSTPTFAFAASRFRLMRLTSSWPCPKAGCAVRWKNLMLISAACSARRRLGTEASPLSSLIFTRSKRHSIAEYFTSLRKTVSRLCRADIIQDQNQFHLRGSTELPRDIHDLG